MVAIVQSGRFGVAFDPLSISWAWAAWAEDPGWTPPADGGAVSSWNDASAGTRHATQATGTKQPLYRASESGLNNKPTVDFDGVDDYLFTSSWSISQPTCRVIVLRMKSVRASRHFFSTASLDPSARNDCNTHSAGNYWVTYSGIQLISATAADTSAHLLIAEYNGTSGKIQLDGTTIKTGAVGTQAHSDVCLGTYGGLSTSCTSLHIAFAAVRAGTLTADEKADLLAWSQSHYGTP